MEQRLTERKIFNQPLSFETSHTESFEIIQKNALGVDISSAGLGLTTEYALKKGEVLKVYIPAADTVLPFYAEVVWSKPTDNYRRAGLRFLS
jgi:alpha-glucuronidase